jgi:hypothetical protein
MNNNFKPRNEEYMVSNSIAKQEEKNMESSRKGPKREKRKRRMW